MNRLFEHRRVHQLLYEYVRGETSPGDVDRVEKHIARCSRCAAELDELQKGFQSVPPTGINPADVQPDEFWRQFLNEVDVRIDRSRTEHVPTFLEEWDVVISWLVARQRWVIGLGGAVAAVVLTLILLNPANAPKQDQQQPELTVKDQPVPYAIQVNARAGDYFRRSQALLVGISNMKIEHNQPVDLSTEQTLSRQLVHEARFLKQQPLDSRSARAVSDVEKVLIQLSNARIAQEVPNVELIRSGIHQQNLLFKLRMAESFYDSARFAFDNNLTKRK